MEIVAFRAGQMGANKSRKDSRAQTTVLVEQETEFNRPVRDIFLNSQQSHGVVTTRWVAQGTLGHFLDVDW
jgi:hypothetical protein